MIGLDPAWFPLLIDPEASLIDLTNLERDPAGGGGDAIEGRDGFTLLDCGAWAGDGKTSAAQRSFGLVCGRTAVLCEFSGTRPVQPLADGPPDEIAPLNRALGTLAGPMRFDVTVRKALRSIAGAPLPEPPPRGERTVYLLLPDLRLPLVPRLPDVDPDLVPDPSKATCACHGPIVSRMLYGTPEAPARYRAVGAPLSRNPNDWFYWMAESYRAVATDLLKLLDRLSKHPSPSPVHVVQLGGLCEVWTGYRCVLQRMGRAALVEPSIVGGRDPEALLAKWSDKALGTKSRDAVSRLVGLPRQRRTLLSTDTGAQATWFEEPGVLRAERGPEQEEISAERPLAVLALREQQAQFRPWRRDAPPGCRAQALADVLARRRERAFPIHAMAHAGEPCLINVIVGRPAGEVESAVPHASSGPQ